MLKITIPAREYWDERTEEFVTTKEQTLQLEHSLVSLAKWESKWCKSFFSKVVEKTFEETIDYIRCMTLTQNVDPNIYNYLTQQNIDQIYEYINAPMTAVYISETDGERTINTETITSELIYYWMIALNIPFECQKWHLNRLVALIKVCNIKNQPPSKKGKQDILRRNASINAARRKKYNTKG